VHGYAQRRAGARSGAELEYCRLLRLELGRVPLLRGGVLGTAVLLRRDALRLINI
jgi:hypothetical protein